jgi:hypothetical protein
MTTNPDSQIVQLTKQEVPTYMDLLAVVFGAEFIKNSDPKSQSSLLTNRARYLADVTFVGLKLLPSEAALLTQAFSNRPINCTVPSNDDSTTPIPNDLYNLKLSLLLTEALSEGFKALSTQIYLDKPRRKKVEELTERFTQLFKSLGF